jgi:hypothetical protein
MPHNLDEDRQRHRVFLFLLVTVIGFVAGRWRRGDLDCCTSGAWEADASGPG